MTRPVASVSRVPDRRRAIVPVFLRLALAAGFCSAVLDRFGGWGPPGAANVAWGDLASFNAYAARINPWAPAGLVPAIGWVATAAELVLAAALLVGLKVRLVGVASGVLLLLFALGMTVGTGLKTALDASVLAASAAGFALAALGPDPWSVDRFLERSVRPTASDRGTR